MNDPLFTWGNGVRLFHGLPVDDRIVELCGRQFKVAAMRDAADLLDDPHFGRMFVEQDRAPYGLELWPAASMMAEYILQGGRGQGRTALDLGCGLALVSMAAKLTGWNVTAADNDEIALRFAKYNADLNGITLDEYLLFDWHCPPPDRRFDRVFAADILYQRVDHEPILACIAEVLTPGGLAAIADPCRSVADRVPSLAKQASFDVRIIPTKGSAHTGKQIDGRVFELRVV